MRGGNIFLQMQGLVACWKYLLARCKDSLRVGDFFLQVQGLIACRKFLLARCKDSLRAGNFFLQMQGPIAWRKFLLARCMDSLRGGNAISDLLAGSNRPDLPPAEGVSFGVADDYSFAKSFVGTIIRFLLFAAAKVVDSQIASKLIKIFKETLINIIYFHTTHFLSYVKSPAESLTTAKKSPILFRFFFCCTHYFP